MDKYTLSLNNEERVLILAALRNERDRMIEELRRVNADTSYPIFSIRYRTNLVMSYSQIITDLTVVVEDK